MAIWICGLPVNDIYNIIPCPSPFGEGWRRGCNFVQTLLISFFVSFLIVGCRPNKPPTSVSVIWQNNKAIGLSIPKSLVGKNSLDHLQVRLVKPGERFAVLGNFTVNEDQVKFAPVVPLTRAFLYEVLLNDSLLEEIEIPLDESVVAPELLSVYPTQDTVPENLLKMFFHFSQPMVEGQSLQHITLIKNSQDTLKGTFLELQPELWNNESTVLTLWLDPGRIKRDLIPNKELGAPLNAYENYTLRISNQWKSKEGKSLATDYSKRFVTTSRDGESPLPDQWIIMVPSSGTKQPLEIDLKEPLDYLLLNDAIRLVDDQQNFVAGTIQLSQEERRFHFLPDKIWKAGRYTLLIEGRLEDLAGNNLNRPFDKDLKSKEKQKAFKDIFEREFDIR
jgi:hypothetical protein